MGTAIFNRASGEILKWVRRGSLDFDLETEISVDCDEQPFENNDTHFFNVETMEVEARSEGDVRTRTYARDRRMAYPPIGDQLDAFWRYLSDGILDPQAQAMMDRINEVKGNYPKQ